MSIAMKVLPFCLLLVVPVWSQETSTVPSQPCWAAAPNMTRMEEARSEARSEVTCEICTTIFQGLDDYLLENEDQVTNLQRYANSSINVDDILIIFFHRLPMH